MEKIRREIRLFWTTYGKLLLQVVGVLAIIILVIQFANQYSIMRAKDMEKLTQINKRQAEQKQIEEKKNEEYIEYINQFLKKCENGNVEEAYKMLSGECKKEKYSTINSFKLNYIDKIFNTKKEFKIQTENEKFKIVFLEDALQAGTIENRQEIVDYYNIIEDVLGIKSITINLYNRI